MTKTPHKQQHGATRHQEHGLKWHNLSLKRRCLTYSGAVGMKSSMGIRFSEPGIWSVSISIPVLDFSDEFYSLLTGIKRRFRMKKCAETFSVPFLSFSLFHASVTREINTHTHTWNSWVHSSWVTVHQGPSWMFLAYRKRRFCTPAYSKTCI